MEQQKVNIKPRLRSDYTFDNYARCDYNNLAIHAFERVLTEPCSGPFNPCLVVGPFGSGKTHLIQAAGNSILEKYPQMTVLYVTGNEFKGQYMDAVKGNRIDDFYRFYDKVDTLIVDDIQDLIGPGTQNAFILVFDSLHQNRKQLVFACNDEYDSLADRLFSRFRWGLSVHFDRIKSTDRMTVLKQLAASFPEEVKTYLSHLPVKDLGVLIGMVKTIEAKAKFLNEPVTKKLAQDVVRPFFAKKKRTKTSTSAEK